ncbi:collagen alpha-2(IV) chain-like [Electrophorus electricus]|uniref:collagen alpha-2(IV) chain-like n=1 Tax=Electrophorus electricus TaxID=8005 RepID=UPI0015CFDE72|nr:collagen alpha-2(IV) chain-like [Electrophorus electricus]
MVPKASRAPWEIKDHLANRVQKVQTHLCSHIHRCSDTQTFAWEKGEKGATGHLGSSGNPGSTGIPGDPGEMGPRGLMGIKGARGPPGDTGPPGRRSRFNFGFLLVKHSQSAKVPECPLNTLKLWEGYSLLYLKGQEKVHKQDLGQAGSCVQFFSTIPFSSCNLGTCNYASHNDKSYWLSTTASSPMLSVSELDIEPLISRCVVCEVHSPAISLHSQTTSLPDCPPEWKSLWHGYSFFMHTGSGDDAGGPTLRSSGSCLQLFHTHPTLECEGSQGTCSYSESIYTFWLTVSREGFGSGPDTTTLRGEAQNVSRCNVCMKNF